MGSWVVYPVEHGTKLPYDGVYISIVLDLGFIRERARLAVEMYCCDLFIFVLTFYCITQMCKSPLNHTIIVMNNNEYPLPVSVCHPSIESLARFYRQGIAMINMMADNPRMDLDDAIEAVGMDPLVSEITDGGPMTRIIPVWDSIQGWRFFFLYPDMSRVECGHAMTFQEQ
jgi:hypothetical protein